MSYRALASLVGALIVAAMPMTAVALPTRTAAPQGYAALANFIDAADLGLSRPTGISYSAATHELIVLDGGGSSTMRFVSTSDALDGTATLAAVPGDAINIAYDASRGFLAAVTSTSDLVSIAGAGRPQSGGAGLSHRDIRGLGLRGAAGLATDASGALSILDASGQRIVRLGADAAGRPNPAQASVINLADLAGARVRGLAIQQSNGHLFVLASASKTLYELDPTAPSSRPATSGRRGSRARRASSSRRAATTPMRHPSRASYVADAGASSAYRHDRRGHRRDRAERPGHPGRAACSARHGRQRCPRHHHEARP